MAKERLKEYKEIVVGKDISSEEYRDMVPGFTTVPAIWKDNIFIGGYEDLLKTTL
jgi:glutaredoxin